MQNRLFIISGEQGRGKTTFLKELLSSFKERDIIAAGIMAHGFWQNGQRSGFELENILTGGKIKLCKTVQDEGWQKFRRFYFNPDAFDFGEKALSPERVKEAGFIIIDEVGPLELEGRGWAKAIGILIKETSTPMIWAVRKNLVKEVAAHFNIKDFAEFDIVKEKETAYNFFLNKIRT